MDDIIERLFDARITVSARARDDQDVEVYSALGDASDEIQRLREKCDKLTTMFRRLTPDKFPDTLFIHGVSESKDTNNMPERLYVVPAYGCDFSYVYERTDKTVGPEW